MEKACKNCIYGTIKSEKMVFQDKSIIFLEGQDINRIYTIEEGYIKMSKFLDNGDEYIIGVLGPGDYIALLALLQGKEHYIASASCLSKVTLRAMSPKDIKQAYQANPKFKDLCLHCAITRSNLFHRQMLISANTDIKDKILLILKNLSYKFGAYSNNQLIVRLPFSKTVLARIINIRRETLSRHLSAMQDDEVLFVEKNEYRLNYVI